MENPFSKHNHDYHDEDDVVDNDVVDDGVVDNDVVDDDDDNVVSGAFVVPASLDDLHLL